MCIYIIDVCSVNISILCSASAQRTSIKNKPGEGVFLKLGITWQKSPAKIEQKSKLEKNKKGRSNEFVVPTTDGKALRSKANPARWKGFVKQSQSIMMASFAKQSQSSKMEGLCEAQPIKPQQKGFAKQSRSNPAKFKGFASQSRSITTERLCEAKPIHHNWKALRS